MSLIAGPYYRGNPKVKPRQWGPLSSVQAAVRDWFNRNGMPAPVDLLPFWGCAGSFLGNVGSSGSLWAPLYHEWIENHISLNNQTDNSTIYTTTADYPYRAFTIFASIRIDSPMPTANIMISEYNPLAYSNGGYYINYGNTNGSFEFLVDNSSVAYHRAQSNSINIEGDGLFHNCVFTYDNVNRVAADPGYIEICVDGIEGHSTITDTAHSTGMTGGPVRCDIGSRDGDTENVDADFKIWGVLPHYAMTTEQASLWCEQPYAALRPRSIPFYSFPFTELKQYGNGAENYQAQWVSGQWTITNDDKFAAADTISLIYEDTSGPTIITITDAGSGNDFVDNIEVTGATIITVTDSGGGTDVIVQLLNSLAVSDTGSGADTNPSSASAGVADAGTASEAVTNAILATVADVVSGIDANSITVQANVTDSGVGADSAIPSVAITITDTGTAVETFGGAVPIVINELANGVDAVAVTMAAIAVADAATASEVEAIQHSIVSIADSGTASSLVGLFTDTLKTVLDSGLGTESDPSVTLSAISVNDVATTLDVSSILNALTVADFSGSSDQVANVLQSFLATVADSATGADEIANVIVGCQVSDVAAATDLVSGVMASLSMSDTGLGSDSIIKFVPLADGTYLVQFIAKAKSFGLTGKALNFDLTAK